MTNFFRKRMESDRADAILVTILIMMPLMLLVFGLAIDTAKNSYMSNVYMSKAQSSVETAVKTIDARGSLNNTSVNSLVTEFKKQNGAISGAQTAEGTQFQSETCSVAEVNGKKRTLPYYDVKLSTVRGKAGVATTSVHIEGNKITKQIPLDPSKKYRVISADIYTSTGNAILGMVGMPCQTHKSSVSAVAFGDNEDLR